jgi:hypothetical protein
MNSKIVSIARHTELDVLILTLPLGEYVAVARDGSVLITWEEASPPSRGRWRLATATSWRVMDHRRDDTPRRKENNNGITAESACPGKSGYVGAVQLARRPINRISTPGHRSNSATT